MQPWSMHSNKTGGYFRCNRFQEDEKGADGEVSTENRGEGSAADSAKKTAEKAKTMTLIARRRRPARHWVT